MKPIEGNSGGQWHGNSSPTPAQSAKPIVENPIKPQKVQEFTKFTYEGWTIHFLEAEPFTWYVTHECPENVEKIKKLSSISIRYTLPGERDLYTDVACSTCDIVLPQYTYLILRRTRKMLLRGKVPLR